MSGPVLRYRLCAILYGEHGRTPAEGEAAGLVCAGKLWRAEGGGHGTRWPLAAILAEPSLRAELLREAGRMIREVGRDGTHRVAE